VGLEARWGYIGVLAGNLVLEHPLFSVVLAPVVVFVVGILAVIRGGPGLSLGLRGGGWGVGILGTLSLLFVLAVLFHPLIGSVLLPFVLGIFMLIGGVVTVVAAFRMRSGSAPARA